MEIYNTKFIYRKRQRSEMNNIHFYCRKLNNNNNNKNSNLQQRKIDKRNVLPVIKNIQSNSTLGEQKIWLKMGRTTKHTFYQRSYTDGK